MRALEALELALARERRGGEALWAAGWWALLRREGDPGFFARKGAAAAALRWRKGVWPSPLPLLAEEAAGLDEGAFWRAPVRVWRWLARAEARTLALVPPEAVRPWASRLAALPPWARLFLGTGLLWMELEGAGAGERFAFLSANLGVFRSLRPGDGLRSSSGLGPDVGPPPF